MKSLTKQPNILWIMADQVRAAALSDQWVLTPHLDQLAREGALFSHCFAQSPVCVPSRASLVTGRYPHSHCARKTPGLLAGEPHLFRALKKAGFQTGLVGKNHMFSPDEMKPLDWNGEWEEWREGKQLPQEWQDHLHAVGDALSTTGSWAGARFHDFPEEFSSTHIIGENTLAALDTLAQNDAPFFLWSSFYDPHAPHTAPRRFESLYPPEKVPLPAGWKGEELAQKPLRQRIKRAAQHMDQASQEDIRRYRAVYAAMISYVDEWIGRILAKLDELGLRENTVVVFTSDHGDFNGEHGMVKKDLVLYDCLLNVPLVVRFPGTVEGGQRLETLVEQIDIHPTLCEWAGARVPPGVQGKSLGPVLRGETKDHRIEIFAEACAPDMKNPYPDYASFIADWNAHNRTPDHLLQWSCNFNIPGDYTKAIRDSNYKYIWYGNGDEELYDLQDDPGETRNLARQKPDLCLEARFRLFSRHVETEDTLDASTRAKISEIWPWEQGSAES